MKRIMGLFSRFLRWCCGCFGIKKGSSSVEMGSFFFWKRFPSQPYFSKYIAGEAHKGTQRDVYGYSTLPDSRRKVPVKETNVIVKAEDSNGNKMINEYVRECRIGTGSYGKVVLHRNTKDGKLYALKVLHKYRLSKVRVAPTETALTDVLREVEIMKTVEHPNIVNLVEVIDDPNTDQLCMVLEYVEGRWIFEGSGPAGGLGEDTARIYFRDVLQGLIYLHNCNIVHGDLKPENLLVTSNGRVKICDFSVSRMFTGSNDELRRSPGTPVYTAPECCVGVTYHGKSADVWALGVTLYCMVLGHYPFIGHTLQDIYEKIVQDPLLLPENMNPDLADLLQGLLCKDPSRRMKLDAAARHPWVVKVNESTLPD